MAVSQDSTAPPAMTDKEKARLAVSNREGAQDYHIPSATRAMSSPKLVLDMTAGSFPLVPLGGRASSPVEGSPP